MKLSDMKPCASCGGALPPIWYVVRVSAAMLKQSAFNSTMGLVQHFGGMRNPGALAVAETLSPEAECVMIMGDEQPSLMTEIALCQQCYTMKEVNLALLAEIQERKF